MFFLSSFSIAQLFNYDSDSTLIPNKNYFKNIKPPLAEQTTESLKKETLNQYIKNSQTIERQDYRFTSKNNSAKSSNSVSKKQMTAIPNPLTVSDIDASDFRDPLLSVRGMDLNTERVLSPGTTIDGIRFYSSNKNKSFIEAEYRNSNFSIDNIYGRVISYAKGQKCLTCHTGIEEISPNHRFSCTSCHGGNGKANSKKSAHKEMISNPSNAHNLHHDQHRVISSHTFMDAS